MLIIKNYADLYSKFSDGVKYADYINIFNDAYLQEIHHPFASIRTKERVYLDLLSAHYACGNLTIVEYSISIVTHALYRLAISVKGFLSNDFRHWEFDKDNADVASVYEYITCSKGIDRVKTYAFNGMNIYDVPVIKKKKNLSYIDRLKVLFIMINNGVLSYWHAAQYYILLKTKPAIIANNIVMEEGRDYVGRCFVHLFRSDNAITVLSVATPMMRGMKEKAHFQNVVTNNTISLRQLSECNYSVEHVNFPPNIDRTLYKPFDCRCIGYAPDMGNPVLTIPKKQSMDQTFFKTIQNSANSVLLTIHPQDNIRLYDQYLASANVSLRGEKTLEEFFSNIDVLVTWWSSLIFQSIYIGVPVIVLDFYQDKHADHLASVVPSFVKIAKNFDELEQYINCFRDVSSDVRQSLHESAVKSLFNS